jgi:hypothetical protein
MHLQCCMSEDVEKLPVLALVTVAALSPLVDHSLKGENTGLPSIVLCRLYIDTKWIQFPEGPNTAAQRRAGSPPPTGVANDPRQEKNPGAFLQKY